MSKQVDEGEVVATAWALEFSLEVGINQGILQGDSNVDMKSLVDVAQPLASFGTFINGLFGLGGGRGSVCVYIYIYTYILAFSLFFLLFYIAKHGCWTQNK